MFAYLLDFTFPFCCNHLAFLQPSHLMLTEPLNIICTVYVIVAGDKHVNPKSFILEKKMTFWLTNQFDFMEDESGKDQDEENSKHTMSSKSSSSVLDLLPFKFISKSTPS